MVEPPDEEEDQLLGKIALVILTVAFTSIVWLFAGTYENPTVRTLLETSVSIILTGIVALIYYRQWQTGREQADIARTQRDIADAMKDFQSRPALNVVDKQPTKYGWKIHLGNFGFGPAHDLKLEVDLQTSVKGYTLQESSTQLEKQLEDSGTNQISSNAILPKSEAEPFLSNDITMQVEESGPAPICSLFEELAIHGEESDTITIDLTISGVDAFGKEHTCDAGQYSIIITDLENAASYSIDNIVTLERN